MAMLYGLVSYVLGIYRYLCYHVCVIARTYTSHYACSRDQQQKLANKFHNDQLRSAKLVSKQTETLLFNAARKSNSNNVVNRNSIINCVDFYEFDNNVQRDVDRHVTLEAPMHRRCYGCCKLTRTFHHDYVYSCNSCGDKFLKYRLYSKDLTGRIALVTGARSKLGHQIVIKLLKSNCIVIGTTRNPGAMKQLFVQYGNRLDLSRLHVYNESLDFDSDHIVESVSKLRDYIQEHFGKLDILINSAAQTIRAKEKNVPMSNNHKNKYGDAKFVPNNETNSWTMDIFDIEQEEMMEIYRINAIAPLIMVQVMYDLMVHSECNPFIINVHAREGLISPRKSGFHIHTNFGKTALHMLTACLPSYNWRTKAGKLFKIHGCCPGWISVDEYYEENRPWIVAPLDDVDGASRILYPLYHDLSSHRRTRRHYDQFMV